jgi:uroporphyrin-III C-methyltransferase/precorrin-2 dehydrogenase/sirohydrochlorin ferrochelatase
MSYLPIFLDTSVGAIAVVGSTHAAIAKLRLLRSLGANVRWYPCTPEVDAGVVASAPGSGTLDVVHAAAPDLTGIVALVASAGKGIDEKLSQRCRAAGIPVNVVDRVDLSTFIVPAIVDRGDVIVAIGTGGTSPVIARRLREKIEAFIPARIGDLSGLIGRYRARFVGARRSISARAFWERIIDGPVGALALAGRTAEAEAQLVAAIDARDDATDSNVGTVYLVGAGPGDPDLLTLKAAQALADADIVFHDDLVSGEILNRARRDADRIFVGKRRGHPGTPQDEINAMLVEAARLGKRVVRLKGGDPFIFGRGGEELEALRAAGIPVVVVPGITAALGCAAEASLPLTFRNEATQLAIITAHRADAAAGIDWTALADPKITVAVYMGLQSAPAVRDGLLAAGRSPKTPAAVLSRGTRGDSKAVVGRLDNLPALAAQAGDGPALLVIGDVVARSDAWRTLEALAAEAA